VGERAPIWRRHRRPSHGRPLSAPTLAGAIEVILVDHLVPFIAASAAFVSRST
jgi:hypothetical protein